MIRRGLYCDLDDIVRLARDFWSHTIYDEPFDSQLVRDIAAQCIDNNLMAVLDLDGVVGFTCAVKGPLLACSSVFTATEIAWWIDPEYRKGRYGIELMKFIESLAKEQGVKYFNMISMESCSPEVAERIYQCSGYHKTETSHTKVL